MADILGCAIKCNSSTITLRIIGNASAKRVIYVF